MGGKVWPILKSCNHQVTQHHEAKDRDRLSQLPNDILLLIMSFLTMKEGARSSVVSKKMNYLWRSSLILIFADHSVMTRIFDEREFRAIPKARTSFLGWVNKVVEAHTGAVVDELRVTFDLDNSCQSDVNKWVAFAMVKQVKILELDCSPVHFGSYPWTPIQWNISLDQPLIADFKYCLKSLSLKYVNISGQDVDFLLVFFEVLENLCIYSSPSLTHVRYTESPLKLKHLEVSQCCNLKTIDINAPKLLSFRHRGCPIELNLRNAALLSEVSVGYIGYRGDVVDYAFNSLSKYFSQLEYLSWEMRLFKGLIDYDKFNLRINNPPTLSNLKHLELHVYAQHEQSLLGWAELIEASPLLERLCVKLQEFPSGNICREVVRHSGRPLKSLKTLEFSGNLGLPIAREFMIYVVENSIMLKDVIVECTPLDSDRSKLIREYGDKHDVLQRILPRGVNLILKTRGETME